MYYYNANYDRRIIDGDSLTGETLTAEINAMCGTQFKPSTLAFVEGNGFYYVQCGREVYEALYPIGKDGKRHPRSRKFRLAEDLKPYAQHEWRDK